LKKFEKDIINVLYDADEDCLEQIKDRNQHLESQLHVLPYALSDKCKSSVININYDPYTSSLLESNKLFDSYYMFNNNHDYIMGETAKTVEKRNIEVESIDHIFGSNNVSLPKPDYLSIDVEGGEYDILRGSIETMQSSILAIYSEVSFFPFRKNQKNFSELCDLLSTQGFSFVTFANSEEKIWMEEMSPYRYPIGLRGGGFHTLSEALFLRKIDVVKNLFSDPIEQYINLRKLAIIAIVYNQIEYGLECLKQSKKIKSKHKVRSELNYFKFLDELEVAEKTHPKLFPKTFMSIYTIEKSMLRFKGNKKSKIKTIAKKIPLLPVFYKLVFRIFNYCYEQLKKMYLLLSFNSDFEKVYIKFGLIKQFRLIKKKRIIQQSHLPK